MEIAGVRQFLRRKCSRQAADGRWRSFFRLRREIARWINTNYFPRDAEIPRAGISEAAFMIAARMEGYELTHGGVLEAVSLETCIFLSFTPEYERLRRQRLRVGADLYSHIFGD
jgi:hypothetical protein